MSAAYTTGEAVRLSGVRARTLDFWVRSGVLTPSVARADGKGTDRLFSLADIVALCGAEELRRAGVELRAARPAIDYLAARDYGASSWSTRGLLLVCAGGELFECHREGVGTVLRRCEGSVVWWLDLERLTGELAPKLATRPAVAS